MLAFGGCATTDSMLGRNQQTWTMSTAEKIPAAQGKVEVAHEKSGNNDVKVKVEHLARADEVFEGTSTYVVWVKPDNGLPQNVGVLQVGSNLKGELKTKTPYKSFDVMVTAEMSPSATAPSTRSVMEARVDVAT